MICRIKGLLLLVAICLLFLACSTNTNKDWITQCEKAVKQFADKPFSKITYSPLPQFKPTEPFLVLSWSGLNIPIPNTQYQDILINKENNDDLSILLVSENEVLINVGRLYGNAKLKSLFEVVGEPPSAEETQWMKESFEKPLRTTDLIDIAYKTQPIDINCNDKNQAEVTVKISSLVLKSTNPKLKSVHKLALKDQNWVDIKDDYFDANKSIATVNIVDESRNNDEIKQISYVITGYSDDFSLFAGITKSEVKTDNPLWLSTLNKALNTKKRDDWLAFFDAAKKANISNKTIAASKQALNID